MTHNYYNINANAYFDSTINIDMSSVYERFISLLPSKSMILDAGCGSGRDSREFKRMGHVVVPMDSSHRMCVLASRHLLQEVICMDFEDIKWCSEFDGVWACSSLLHVSRDNLPRIINKLANSLKPNGVLYMSFKLGNTDRIKDGRQFTDMDEPLFADLATQLPSLKEITHWFSSDLRNEEKMQWMNIIMGKI